MPEGAGTPDPNGDTAWGFTRKDAERIASTVKRIEATYRNTPPPRGRYGPGPGNLVPADSGSGFTAGSRSAPTTATVTLLKTSGTAGGLAVSTTTVTAYNTFTTAIGAGKTIWLSSFNGRWYVVQVDC